MSIGTAQFVLFGVAPLTCGVWLAGTRAPMPVETAEVIFLAIAVPMWAVWLFGTWFALSRVRAAKVPEVLPDNPEARDVLTGEAEIKGDAETLSKKIAGELIGASSAGGMSGIRITERTAERIAFEKVKGVGGRMPAFDSGLVTLATEGDRVRVRYAVSQKRFVRIMRLVTYLVCFLYGGAIVTLVPILVWKYAVHGASAAARAQVLQTIQMAHGVWPPFLVGFLSGYLVKRATRFFDTLLANLEHIV